MRVLICGDSFSAKTGKGGWPELLETEFKITNLSQAGCGEYRILKQIESIDLKLYDSVIINHTSPFRIYIKEHPIHKDNTLHHSCDLLYEDVNAHKKDKVMRIAKEYFENIFDEDHAKDIYKLILGKIDSLANPMTTLHCSHLEWDHLYRFKNFMYFNDTWNKHRGNINHYDECGNKKIYEAIRTELLKIRSHI